jgi:pyruvate kinase
MAGFDAELGNGEPIVGTDSLMSFPPGLRSATSRAQLAAESRSGSKGNLSSMSVHSIGGTSDYCEPLAGDPLIADSVDSILEPGDQAPNPLTKVVCTIGGSAHSVDTLSDMLTAGMSVARIDLSWGSRSYHQHTLHNLRSAMQRTKSLCAVMLDTKGPETQVVLGSDEGSVCESDESIAPSALSIAIDAGSTVVLQSSLPEASQPLELLEASSSQQMLSETQRLPSANGNFHNNNCNNNTASSNSRSTSNGGDDNTILLRVNNTRLPQLVQPGDEVFVGQYLASGFEGGSAFLEVENATASQVRCRAVNSARIGGVLLTVHVRGLEEGVQCIHEQEVEDIAKLAAPNSIEFISLSFTSSAADVQQARALLSHHGLPHCRVVAKVEGQEAVSNLEEIVTAADGVMLSRGNLGLELHPEKVFLAQKYALRMCNQLGKPCIVTRVVDTLVESPSPTRAEATDVANACLDGTDAILLGAETIRGLYPVQSVKTVLSICSEAEKVFNADHFFRRNVWLSQDEESGMQHAEALASSAVRAAYKIAAKLIVVFTQTGNTARMVSKYRPYQPVLCVVVPSVSRESTKWVIHGSANARQLLINRNLTPFLAHFNTTSSPDAGTSQPGALSCALEHARSRGIASSGDRVVVCQKIGATSVVKVVEA